MFTRVWHNVDIFSSFIPIYIITLIGATNLEESTIIRVSIAVYYVQI